MLKTFSITDIGRKRKVNQDYIYTSEKPVGNLPNVFIVADGMGGHNAGDYASKVTVETMLAEMENSFEKNPTLIFRKAIEEANDVIRKRAGEDEKFGRNGDYGCGGILHGQILTGGQCRRQQTLCGGQQDPPDHKRSFVCRRNGTDRRTGSCRCKEPSG